MVEWVSERIGTGAFRNDARAIGVARDGTLIAAVVFDNFSDGSCCISVASDGTRRWLNRAFLVHVFAYPFRQLGHRRITAFIAERNTNSIRFCEACGFRWEGRLRRGAGGDEDLLVYGLLRSECRFLPGI